MMPPRYEPEPGELAVDVSTLGDIVDSDGYTVTVSNGDRSEVTTRRVDVNAELKLRLRPGSYAVSLGDAAPACRLMEIPFPYVGFLVSVESDKITTLALHVRCAATPDGTASTRRRRDGLVRA